MSQIIIANSGFSAEKVGTQIIDRKILPINFSLSLKFNCFKKTDKKGMPGKIGDVYLHNFVSLVFLVCLMQFCGFSHTWQTENLSSAWEEE